MHLLSGQRGSGRSTELRRLRRSLYDQGCEVFLCDMRDYRHLTTPVEGSDLLISVMGALNAAVQEIDDKDCARESYWQRLSRFLQIEVGITDLTLAGNMGVGKVGISASLKDDPSFKERLQGHLRGPVARLVRQAHEFATEAVTVIRQSHDNPNKKVVLLIASVEQIRGVGVEAERMYKRVENRILGSRQEFPFPFAAHGLYDTAIPDPFDPRSGSATGRWYGVQSSQCPYQAA